MTIISREINSLDPEKVALNLKKIREDFPILKQQVNNHPLVYLDNAATTQKPMSVIKSLEHYYLADNSNVHRGVHTLSQRATTNFETTRESIRKYINAKHQHEIIYTAGTTGAINLVADSYGRANIKLDDEIIISTMEHHSNIVPWQLLCERVGAKIKVIPIYDNGELDLDAYKKLFNKQTRLVAITHASNVLGTINPLQEIIKIAHHYGVPVLVDGAQAAAHTQIDVQALDCDFYTLSAHKIYGPTGIGILYGKAELLEKMPPYQGGGYMISQVSFDKTTFNQLPYKFEAGTPNIADVIGFNEAINYVNDIGLPTIIAHEQKLLSYAMQALTSIDGLRIIGTAKEKCAVIAFVMDDIHAHDIGTILDQHGIAVRAGHHCAMPLMQRYNLAASVRASFALYNTVDEIDALVAALLQVKRLFNV